MNTPEQDIESILESIHLTLTNVIESLNYLDERISALESKDLDYT